MLTLTIHHNIFLTKEQRYELVRGQDIVTVGVSVPVWFVEGFSSEPAKEIFCKYLLSNIQQDIPIQIREDGYEIVIPYRSSIYARKAISDEEWRRYSEKERRDYYATWKASIHPGNLLDPSDGGTACITYREHNKADTDGKKFSIVHFVNIDDISQLEESITV